MLSREQLEAHLERIDQDGYTVVEDAIEPEFVSALYDDKGKEVAAPFAQIFLPLAKIDYYVVL